VDWRCLTLTDHRQRASPLQLFLQHSSSLPPGWDVTSSSPLCRRVRPKVDDSAWHTLAQAGADPGPVGVWQTPPPGRMEFEMGRAVILRQGFARQLANPSGTRYAGLPMPGGPKRDSVPRGRMGITVRPFGRSAQVPGEQREGGMRITEALGDQVFRCGSRGVGRKSRTARPGPAPSGTAASASRPRAGPPG
jgi:hypothetical protein